MRSSIAQMGNGAPKFFVDAMGDSWAVYDRTQMLPDGKLPESSKMWSGSSQLEAMKICGELNTAFLSRKGSSHVN